MLFSVIKTLKLFIFFFVILPAFASELPRIPEALLDARPTQAYQIPGAQVVLADYEALKEDFPSLKNKSNGEIDELLLQQAALMAKTQTDQQKVNTPIPTGNPQKTFRPLGYGRALVVPFAEGLIDIKGAGSVQPNFGTHSNGLMTLGEAVREFLYERLIAAILSLEGYVPGTVNSYAVLALPFDVIHRAWDRDPAGLYLRQAHRRNKWERPSHGTEIEKILRRYGITSYDEARRRYLETNTLDRHNLQTTTEGAVFDFGSFLTTNHLGEYSPIDESRRLPFELWGHSVTEIPDSKYDNPWAWSHELAHNWKRGIAHRSDFEQHARNLLNPVLEKLHSPTPESAQTSSCFIFH